MKIRSQLALLVVAVVVPVALLAAATTARLWTLQREAYEQRYLERVSALRLALDTRLDATTRLLRGLSGSGELDDPALLPRFVERFDRLLQSNPEWATVGLRDAQGKPVAARTRAGTPPIPPPAATPDDGLRPVFSDLREVGGGSFVTFVAVPVLRDEASRGSLYVGIDQHGWLEFLRSYPIADGATLTLNDRTASSSRARSTTSSGSAASPGPSSCERTRARDEGVLAERAASRDSASIRRSAAPRLPAGCSAPACRARRSRRRCATRRWRCSSAASRPRSPRRRCSRSASAGACPRHGHRRFRRTPAELRRRTRHAPGPRAAGDRRGRDDPQRARRGATRARAREPVHEAPSPRGAARADAEHANAAKDEFLAMLGHELRNPLSAISVGGRRCSAGAGARPTMRSARAR